MANKIIIIGAEEDSVIESPRRPVIFIDEKEVEYKIQFIKGGGIRVNKFDPSDESAIAMMPFHSNEIKIQ